MNMKIIWMEGSQHIINRDPRKKNKKKSNNKSCSIYQELLIFCNSGACRSLKEAENRAKIAFIYKPALRCEDC